MRHGQFARHAVGEAFFQRSEQGGQVGLVVGDDGDPHGCQREGCFQALGGEGQHVLVGLDRSRSRAEGQRQRIAGIGHGRFFGDGGGRSRQQAGGHAAHGDVARQVLGLHHHVLGVDLARIDVAIVAEQKARGRGADDGFRRVGNDGTVDAEQGAVGSGHTQAGHEDAGRILRRCPALPQFDRLQRALCQVRIRAGVDVHGISLGGLLGCRSGIDVEGHLVVVGRSFHDGVADYDQHVLAVCQFLRSVGHFAVALTRAGNAQFVLPVGRLFGKQAGHLRLGVAVRYVGHAQEIRLAGLGSGRHAEHGGIVDGAFGEVLRGIGIIEVFAQNGVRQLDGGKSFGLSVVLVGQPGGGDLNGACGVRSPQSPCALAVQGGRRRHVVLEFLIQQQRLGLYHAHRRQQGHQEARCSFV